MTDRATAAPWRWPFREHRTMQQVLDMAALERLHRERGWLYGGEALKLHALECRAHPPPTDEPEPPQAA